MRRHTPARYQQGCGGAEEHDGGAQLGAEEQEPVDDVGQGVAGGARLRAAAVAAGQPLLLLDSVKQGVRVEGREGNAEKEGGEYDC